MIKIDCRVKNKECYCDDIADLALENSEDIDNLYGLLACKACADLDFTENSYDIYSLLMDKVNLLANHIGLEFVVEPEVPAIPAKLVLRKITKKTTKKTVKKAVKKSAPKKSVKKVSKKK